MNYVVHTRHDPIWRYEVDDESTSARIDLFRSLAPAESACAALNIGAARINPHALIGCRVEVSR